VYVIFKQNQNNFTTTYILKSVIFVQGSINMLTHSPWASSQKPTRSAVSSLILHTRKILTHSLTHSMVQNIIWKADCHSAYQKISCVLYGTWSFITVLTKACHWTLSWASWIQFTPSIPISLRSSLHTRKI